MTARARDTICLLACAVLGALVWAIHETSLSHAVQRPLKVAVIVIGLGLIGLWRAHQIRRAAH
jgi:glucose dehydrogenase